MTLNDKPTLNLDSNPVIHGRIVRMNRGTMDVPASKKLKQVLFNELWRKGVRLFHTEFVRGLLAEVGRGLEYWDDLTAWECWVAINWTRSASAVELSKLAGLLDDNRSVGVAA